MYYYLLLALTIWLAVLYFSKTEVLEIGGGGGGVGSYFPDLIVSIPDVDFLNPQLLSITVYNTDAEPRSVGFTFPNANSFSFLTVPRLVVSNSSWFSAPFQYLANSDGSINTLNSFFVTSNNSPGFNDVNFTTFSGNVNDYSQVSPDSFIVFTFDNSFSNFSFTFLFESSYEAPLQCITPEVDCGGKCLNPVQYITDENCGACGNECIAPTVCTNPLGGGPWSCAEVAEVQ